MFHLSKSSLMRSNRGIKFDLYIWSKAGVIYIPKYINPIGDHLKGKGNGTLGFCFRLPRGIASDLLKFIMYPEKALNLLTNFNKSG